MNQIELHERALLSRLLNGDGPVKGLRQIPKVTVYLDHPDLSKRDLIIMIGIGDLDFSRVVLEYERRGVIVYERVASSIYSKRMLDSFKLKGGIRVSHLHEIGRASCRERVGRYGYILGVAVSLKKKYKNKPI